MRTTKTCLFRSADFETRGFQKPVRSGSRRMLQLSPLGLFVSFVFFVVFHLPTFAAEPTNAPAHPLNGSWRWTFTMPEGTTTRPKLTLFIQDGRIAGITSFRPGTATEITNTVVTGNDLRFQVIRERDSRNITTTYSGTLTNKKILGRIESNWDGKTHSYPWEATRAHEGAEGVWKWAVLVRGRWVETWVELEQDGEVLTGTMPGRRRRIFIEKGSIKNDEVYFEVERGTDETKVVTRYRGKQIGDVIRGTIVTVAEGEEREEEWLARRVD